jgi:type I restriction enzyme S subunit
MSVPALRFKGDSGEWEVKRLIELAKVYDGTHMTPDYKETGVPFYSVEHLTNNNFKDTKYISTDVYEKENKRVMLEMGDILMTRIGDIGTAKYINWNVKASFYVSLALIKQSKNINAEFLSHFISSPCFQKELHQRTIHVAFPKKINLGEIGECLVSFPRNEEQTKIANFLTVVDRKISQLTQKNELLAKYKKGVMQQIFNQELRFKDDDGQSFPAWGNSTLEDVSINYHQGINTTLDKVEYVDEGIPIIQAKHITGEYLDFSDARGLSQSDYDKYKKKFNPKINDLLISNIGTLGKVVLVETEINFLIAWNIFKVTLNTDRCYPKFIKDFLKKIASDGYFDSIKTGNATKFVNKSDMLAIEILMPCLREQTKIAEFLNALDEKILAAQSELGLMKQYKQGLLQQMFI